MNPIPDTLRDSTLGRLVEAYRNPRLEDPDADYLSDDHLEELRDQSEIRDYNISKPVTIPEVGTVQQISFTTKQGYTYAGAHGVPAVQRNDTLGLSTGPLGSSANGYPRHLMLNYLRAGNYVGYMTSNGVDRTMNREADTKISLASTAAALLNFGYHLRMELAEQGHDLHEEDRFTYGASKAGAVALIMNAIDTEFAQNMRASDIIAPSPTIKLESVDQWKQVAEQICKEPAHAAMIISRLGLKLALKYRKTVSLNRAELSHQLETCGAIFNGELDAAVSHIPGDKIIRITEYDCDLACNDGGLEQKLFPSTHPNVSFEERKGVHMSIVDRNITLPHMMGFNKAYQELQNGMIHDAQSLFALAKVLAPHQFPITKDQLPVIDQNSAA